MTIWVNLTNSICTCWYQLVSFTIVLNCTWTVIYYCIIVFIDRLLIFICYWSFNSCSFSIFIVNVNIPFFIWLLVVVCYIIRNWFNWRDWEVIKEWFITTCFITWCITTDDIWSIVTNWVNISWELRWSCKGVSSCFIVPTTQTYITTSWIWISLYFESVVSVFTIYITYFFRIGTSSFNSSSCSWFSRIRSVNQSIIIKVQIVYICWWAIWRNFRRVQNIKLNYWWTICRYLFNNTFHIVMCTSTLKFKIFSTNTSQCTTHVIRWICTCVYISFKITWLRSSIILSINTCLSICS